MITLDPILPSFASTRSTNQVGETVRFSVPKSPLRSDNTGQTSQTAAPSQTNPANPGQEPDPITYASMYNMFQANQWQSPVSSQSFALGLNPNAPVAPAAGEDGGVLAVQAGDEGKAASDYRGAGKTGADAFSVEEPDGTDAEESDKAADPGEDKSVDGSKLNSDEQRQLDDLKQRDAEVRQHEQAHKSTGGQYAGAMSFEYQRGPDGNRYATGGEVQVDVSRESDPSATIQKMEQVRAAALAPAEPSSQDRSVAAQAQKIAADARSELQDAGSGSDKRVNQSGEAKSAGDEEGEGGGEENGTGSAQSVAGVSGAAQNSNPRSIGATGDDDSATSTGGAADVQSAAPTPRVDRATPPAPEANVEPPVASLSSPRGSAGPRLGGEGMETRVRMAYGLANAPVSGAIDIIA